MDRSLSAGQTFLEAKRAIAGLSEASPLPFFLAMSGSAEPLVVFLEGAAAARGRLARVGFPPFGTLGQLLAAPPPEGRIEVFLAFPWDLLPEADWRTGVSARSSTLQGAIERANRWLERVGRRAPGRLVYVAAPIPPLASAPEVSAAIERVLTGLLAQSGAEILPPECFSLASYLSSGCPVAGSALGRVAAALLERLVGRVREPAKVLVTDFDETLWAGVLSEDGEAGIAHQASGRGYRHFLYQTHLARLKTDGALLAGVTRNSLAVVQPVLERGEMVLKADDFVHVLAGYGAKSSQIDSLARRLDLGLGSFVFVDDNEVELAEVSRALPEVACLQFPRREDDLPELLAALSARFGRDSLTAEDRERTALYRRRLEGMIPEGDSGADIRDFLACLEMRLVIRDRSTGDRARAVQLINKTNQFNLDGRRWKDEEIGRILDAGGRLVGATLHDRSGSHGEIIALLIGPDGLVESWVMSCRVFQRRVEYAFLLALLARGIEPQAFRYSATDRNEPLTRFLREPGFGPPTAGLVSFDPDRFRAEHQVDLQLFEISG